MSVRLVIFDRKECMYLERGVNIVIGSAIDAFLIPHSNGSVLLTI